MASEPLLDVRDLRTHFFTREGIVRAVDGVTFSIREGETVGIVGESGCGKSMTAKSILRIVEKPGKIVGGQIFFRETGLKPCATNNFRETGLKPCATDNKLGNTSAPVAQGFSPVSGGTDPKTSGGTDPKTSGGTDPKTSGATDPKTSAAVAQGFSPVSAVDLTTLGDDSPRMRAIRGDEIALIFQEPMSSFSPVHTIGAQMMEMTQYHWRLTRQQARDHAVEMLRKVGVSRPESRVDQYAHQLSGGMRQRAMIALALSCDPRLLIADEPTTSLDVTTQAQILELIRQLQAENGMAVLLITHNLGVVAEMCESVVVMYLGRVVEQGPVEEIFHAPKHPYTRALLQSMPSMAEPARTRLPTIAGSIPHPIDRPAGCPFHPRCPSHMPGTCDKQEPSLVAVGKHHSSACFLHEPVTTGTASA